MQEDNFTGCTAKAPYVTPPAGQLYTARLVSDRMTSVAYLSAFLHVAKNTPGARLLDNN